LTIEMRPFDPAACLDSPESMLAWLDSAFADGEAGEIADRPVVERRLVL
jgi:DNA-binding phage protein